MTTLSKQLRRETSVQVRNGRHRGRQIIVILEPPNHIAFKIKGTRQQYTTTVETCYDQAMKQHALDQWQKKLAEYKAGQRRIKPRKPVFNSL